jgi:excisionase family DNA binding protein
VTLTMSRSISGGTLDCKRLKMPERSRKMQETNTATESPYFDYRRASEYCGVSATTIWRATKRGDLRASGPGYAVRFHRDELDRWMRSRDRK